MTLKNRFLALGEYAGAGAYEEENRSLFYLFYVIISLYLFFIKNASLGNVLSNILEPIPSNNITITFLGCFSSSSLSM